MSYYLSDFYLLDETDFDVDFGGVLIYWHCEVLIVDYEAIAMWGYCCWPWVWFGNILKCAVLGIFDILLEIELFFRFCFYGCWYIIFILSLNIFDLIYLCILLLFLFILNLLHRHWPFQPSLLNTNLLLVICTNLLVIYTDLTLIFQHWSLSLVFLCLEHFHLKREQNAFHLLLIFEF